MKRNTGTYRTISQRKHFIPTSLSQLEPPFTFSQELTGLYGQAMRQLGKINEMSHRLPTIDRFIKAYVIKEALLTSEIEGVQTTLIDVFTTPLFEEKVDKNTQLVLNYTRALNRAIEMMRENNLPVVSRVLLEAHKELMSVGHGDTANPGYYRKQSVRVGKHVPPPATEIPQLMSQLERFINEDDSLPPLIKAGLAHVQFETIHPFLDGNGRIGRLLMILMLLQDGVLQNPIIYISYYLKKEQYLYYHLLDKTRSEGDFESWIAFFFECVIASCKDAYTRAAEIETLEHGYIELIENTDAIRAKEMYKKALQLLFDQPVITITALAKQLGKSFNSAQTIINMFLSMGIVVQQTKQKQNKVFECRAYLALLEKEY